MDGEPWESLRPVLKTDGTERFGERDLRHPPFYREEVEEAETPGLGPGYKHVRVVFPRPFHSQLDQSKSPAC
jgi:hypothetical protein